MWNDFFQAILVIFMLCGILTVLLSMLLLLLSPRKIGKYILTIPAHTDKSDMECLLRGAQLRGRLFGMGCYGGTLVVDCGMDDATYTLCKMLCCELGNMVLCTPEEVPKLLLQWT